MATNNRILSLDIGASGIKAAEFDYDSSGNITLMQFAEAGYSEDLDETNRTIQIAQAIGGLLQNHQFKSRSVMLSISGQFALTRFAKLPPVAEQEHRVRQIVEFEARQNVPFPIEEVVWDYQLIANPEEEELEAMFVVVKNDILDDIITAVQSIGLRPFLVDVSSCAAYNAARANGVGAEQPSIVLDIGGRSSNLMFVDKNQFFSRTIPVAGYTVTQQIAKDMRVSLKEAEELKLRHGFVGLGGAYEEPASEVAANVSKIIRTVMTRLHGEVNRSITLYRSHQKGQKPTRMYLTGGSSLMKYTDKFFAEKLGIEVEFLNSFRAIRISPQLEVQKLEEKAHLFGPLIGLALRYRGACPVEVNLLPLKIKRQLALNQKKPYMAGAVFCILLLLLFSFVSNIQRVQVFEPTIGQLQQHRNQLERKERSINEAMRNIQTVEQQYRGLESLLRRREQWVGMVAQIENSVPDYLWVSRLRPIIEGEMEHGDPFDLHDDHPRGRPTSPFGMPGRMDDMPMDDDDWMFGDDVMEREIVTEESGPSGRIVGVEIVGDSLLIGDHLAAGPQPVRQPIQPPPPRPEEFELPPAPALNNNALPRSEDEEGGPEQIYLARLKRMDFVNAQRTNFEDYRVSDQAPNLRTFRIRVMFEEDIDLQY